VQQRLDVAAEANVRLGGRERAAPAREAQHELLHRFAAAFEEDLGQPSRRHHAEGVAVAAGIFGRDQPLLAGKPHEQGPALA
jgi:hypothetical protein